MFTERVRNIIFVATTYTRTQQDSIRHYCQVLVQRHKGLHQAFMVPLFQQWRHLLEITMNLQSSIQWLQDVLDTGTRLKSYIYAHLYSIFSLKSCLALQSTDLKCWQQTHQMGAWIGILLQTHNPKSQYEEHPCNKERQNRNSF
jgi:hypothetical protein